MEILQHVQLSILFPKQLYIMNNESKDKGNEVVTRCISSFQNFPCVCAFWSRSFEVERIFSGTFCYLSLAPKFSALTKCFLKLGLNSLVKNEMNLIGSNQKVFFFFKMKQSKMEQNRESQSTSQAVSSVGRMASKSFALAKLVWVYMHLNWVTIIYYC